MCKLSAPQQQYIDDLKAAHAAGFTVMYRPSQGCCWVECVAPNWSNHPDCYTMEQVDRLEWEQYKRDRDCAPTQKPHPHAALIKQWADGAVLQLKQPNGEWIDVKTRSPSWEPVWEYRIKPQETDLQKYGVEVGDVWKITKQSGYLFTVQHVKAGCFGDTDGTTREPDDRMVLVFRRGVVNKL
jgi:hypothetical protein